MNTSTVSYNIILINHSVWPSCCSVFLLYSPVKCYALAVLHLRPSSNWQELFPWFYFSFCYIIVEQLEQTHVQKPIYLTQHIVQRCVLNMLRFIHSAALKATSGQIVQTFCGLLNFSHNHIDLRIPVINLEYKQKNNNKNACKQISYLII